MTEHILDGTDVGAVHEQVGGKRVTEGVWSDVFRDAGEAGAIFDNALNGAGGEAAVVAGSIGFVFVARVVEEKGRETIVAGA